MIDAFGVVHTDISKGLPSYLRQVGNKPTSQYSRLKIDSNKYGKASAKARAEHYAGKRSPEVEEAWYLGKISTKSFRNDKWMNAMRYQSKGMGAAENRRKIEGIKQRPLRNI